MALVSCRPGSGEPSESAKDANDKPDRSALSGSFSDLKSEGNPDLQRALDLVDLHYGVKVKHQEGTDRSLQAARAEVNEVLRSLQRKR